MRFSKKIVILIVVLNMIFAAAVLIVFWHTSSEPSALVGAWFAFTTGELWALSKVTREKNKIKKESEEKQV
jgi:flagellar basal body-associated protein FliL